MRRRYPQAQLAFDALRTTNDADGMPAMPLEVTIKVNNMAI